MKAKLKRMLELVEAGKDDLCKNCVRYISCDRQVWKYEGDYNDITFCSDWEEEV
jgi:hypothetical protein